LRFVNPVLNKYDDTIYNTIQYKTYNAPYVTKMLFVGADDAEDDGQPHGRGGIQKVNP